MKSSRFILIKLLVLVIFASLLSAFGKGNQAAKGVIRTIDFMDSQTFEQFGLIQSTGLRSILARSGDAPSPLPAPTVPQAKGVRGLAVTICRDPAVQQSDFAVNEIRAAVSALGGTVTEAPLSALNAAGVTGLRVILARSGDVITGWDPLPEPTVPQAYGIRVKASASLQEILIKGFDAVGSMYGGMDVAEAISMGTLGSLAASDHSPHIAQRGIKFNLPLDARNPSYSDDGDAAQAAIPHVWDINFWKEYLDEMARQRLNTLSLWSFHPFPSMVTAPEYPLIALSDVWRTQVPFTASGGQRGTKASEFWDPAIHGGAANIEIIKKLSPTDKTAFWNQVLDLADARGIAVYIFTWNIFTFGTEGNSYGITRNQNNATTKDYFRCSIRALMTSLPKLAGMGLTAGEGMEHHGGSANENWLASTYGEAFHDVHVGYTATAPGGKQTVVPANPTRPLRLIHRLHEIKYSVAHTYSTTKPNFVTSDMNSRPDGHRTWLTVRMDDQYNARWGDPDFVRSWVNNLPIKNKNGKDQLNGYYMGPDGFTWCRRSNVKDSSLNQLDIKRWWYTNNLFSRLSYDPTITNAFFDQMVAARLRIAVPAAAALNRGLASASQITPWLTKYYWAGGNDFQGFSEACLNSRGFIDVNNYMNAAPIGKKDGNGLSPPSMEAFCKAVRSGSNPLDLSQKVEDAANAALAAIAAVPADAANQELTQVLDDIRILAAMGKYYVSKFRGARDLKYASLDASDVTKANAHRASAVTHLTEALARWTTYADLSAQHYYPTKHNRIGNFDLKALTPYAGGL